jgi:hypothetical protein
MIKNPTFQFKNNPALVELGGTDFQLMLDDMHTSHGTVPKGFVNDGPSVNPYILRLLIKPRTFPRSGYWHDLACLRNLRTQAGGVSKTQYTRWTADALLREAVVAEAKANYFLGKEEEIDAVEYERYLKKANRRAFLIWLGVLIGSKTGYKTIVPARVKELAIGEWSQRFNISVNNLDFDDNLNRVYVK